MKQLMVAGIFAVSMIGSAANAQTDAKAKAILQTVSQKVAAMKSLKANFSLKLASANGKVKDSKKGSFLMKGVKYHVTLSAQEIICDGTTVWTYMKDANEVQITRYNPAEQTMSPTKLFTNAYDKEYRYRYAGTRKVGGKDCDLIEMTLISSAKQFSKVELAVDKSSNIVGGNVFEKNGNQYQYEVSGYVPNAAAPDALFVFDVKQHPKVEVVDLR